MINYLLFIYPLLYVKIKGTPLYMAPQLLSKINERYTSKSEIWSIGIIFYEMLYGKTPW
jgi:serine/threonine-protein kinase ULK2